MLGEIASTWPVRRRRILVIFQDRRRKPQLVVRDRGKPENSSRGGQPVGPIVPVLHPPCRLSLRWKILPNHPNNVLRDRIEGCHRLRISLERPLRNNQIRKLC